MERIVSFLNNRYILAVIAALFLLNLTRSFARR